MTSQLEQLRMIEEAHDLHTAMDRAMVEPMDVPKLRVIRAQMAELRERMEVASWVIGQSE